MKKIAKTYYTIRANIYFVLFFTLFALLFAVLYAPSYGYDTTYWNEHTGLIIPLLVAITFATLTLSRTIMLLLHPRLHLTTREFTAWQALELIVCCFFCDLFLSLYTHHTFFGILLPVLLIGISVAIFPYLTFALIIELHERNHELDELRTTLDEIKHNTHIDEVIQFFDEKNNAKLLVDLNAVYSVESAGNYVNIVYDDKDHLQRFSLRNSMKGVESTCERHGLVRCHRSYYINPRKIKLIRRDPNGTFAEMQRSGLSDIPISSTYASEVAQAFSNI